MLLLLVCGLGSAHGYLLGDDTMLCWKSANLSDCPPGSDLIWQVRPATDYTDSEEFTAIYELNPGSVSNTRSGPNRMLIDHANLHGCRKSIGFWCAHRRPDQPAVHCNAIALHGIPELTTAPTNPLQLTDAYGAQRWDGAVGVAREGPNEFDVPRCVQLFPGGRRLVRLPCNTSSSAQPRTESESQIEAGVLCRTLIAHVRIFAGNGTKWDFARAGASALRCCAASNFTQSLLSHQ